MRTAAKPAGASKALATAEQCREMRWLGISHTPQTTTTEAGILIELHKTNKLPEAYRDRGN